MPLRPGENPHEEELHNVRIEEEELGSLVALRSRLRLHRASAAVRGFGQENILERPHLVLC